MSSNLDCPVDNVTVNETKVRLVAFFVLLLAIAYFVTANRVIVVFLLADFILRAYNLNNYSPLAIISGAVVRLLKLRNKPVDRGPKRFAAFMGLVFLVVILLTSFANLEVLTKALTGILIVFASLESLAGFCAGCYVYSVLKRFKIIKGFA